MSNLPLAFLELLAGGLLVTMAVTGNGLGEVMAGDLSLKSVGSGKDAGKAPGGSGGLPDDVRGAVSAFSSRVGWDQHQVAAWNAVISRESGGRTDARNPSSGAYGIGQFLGATLREYAKFGATSPDAGPQVNAMGHYIRDRYGTPANAWAHEQQFGWY